MPVSKALPLCVRRRLRASEGMRRIGGWTEECGVFIYLFIDLLSACQRVNETEGRMQSIYISHTYAVEGMHTRPIEPKQAPDWLGSLTAQPNKANLELGPDAGVVRRQLSVREARPVAADLFCLCDHKKGRKKGPKVSRAS